MSYSAKHRNIHKPTQHGYSFLCCYTEDGTITQSVSSVRNLGVEMESGATFNKQVSLAIKKGSQIVGWVLRLFRNRQNCAVNAV